MGRRARPSPGLIGHSAEKLSSGSPKWRKLRSGPWEDRNAPADESRCAVSCVGERTPGGTRRRPGDSRPEHDSDGDDRLLRHPDAARGAAAAAAADEVAPGGGAAV